MSKLEPFFFTQRGLMTLTRNPIAHRILDGIPAFTEIRESYRNCARTIDLPAAFDYDEAARAFRDGGNLADLAEAATSNARRTELDTAASTIRDRAQTRHDVAFRDFLHAHAGAIAEGILTGYREIIAAAKAHLPALGNITTIEDTLGDPDATVAYSELDKLARDLTAWMRTAHTMLWPAHIDDSGQLRPTRILAQYDQAWPEFYLAKGISTRTAKGDLITIGAAPNPWPDTFTLLRDIASRDLKIWALTKPEHEAEQQRLKTLAAELQDKAIRNAEKGRPVNMSPTPSPYRRSNI